MDPAALVATLVATVSVPALSEAEGFLTVGFLATLLAETILHSDCKTAPIGC